MKRRTFAITGIAAIALALAWPTAAVAAEPTVSIVVADDTLASDETTTVTFRFDAAVDGFDNSDISVSNGTLTTVASTDGDITWTATLTPTAGITDNNNLITVDLSGVIDEASGDPGTVTVDSNNYAIDTERPTAVATVADTALAEGETSPVTFAFSEAVSGFTNADITVASGSLSAVSSGDGGTTWTTTLTPATDTTDATNVITVDLTGVTDAFGNAGTGSVASNNYAVDTERPTAAVTVADTTLAPGETSLVTFAFTEAVTGFDNADITVPVGTLSAVSTADSGVTWTATYTPDGTLSSGNTFVVNLAGVTDTAGNVGIGTVSSNAFAVQAAAVQPADTLPATGVGVQQLPLIALVLTAFGVGMVLVARRLQHRVLARAGR